MSDVAAASGYARRLVEHEARSSGTVLREAVRPVARRLRLSASSLWGLLYAPPKKIGTETFRLLKTGVEHLLTQEIGRLEHELAILRQSGEDPRSAAFAEVEHHLEEARRALGLRVASSHRGGEPC